jgi:bifunctional non-homologous end joining protein LigD
MASARPKKSASRTPAKKATAAKKSSAKTQPAKKATLKPAATKSATAKKSTKPAPRRKVVSAADSVDAQLARYRSMRDFHVTAEPSGTKRSTTSSPDALPFVIQKHAASHLHYDFRLGWNGVLKSWAVAKGPSYVPADRRLAVQVEDHPMEYGGFEGIIPKGQYGGGTVMVWDQGTWRPQPGYEDVTEALRKGSLKFILDGTKLHGKWTLVRMGPKSSSSSGSRWGSSDKPNWLLIKEHDDFERGPNAPAVTDAEPDSAVTGRTMDQIAHESDHVWNSKETTEHSNPDATAGSGRAWYRNNGDSSPPTSTVGAKFDIRPRRPTKSSSNASTNNLPTESQPAFIPPQLAEETSATPDGPDWLHEIKLDGYRMQARKSGSKVSLLTRKGLDWTHRMRAVADAIAALPTDNLTVDGEVVVLDDRGISSFANLQASFNEGERYPLTYFVFDLLHLDDRNTRDLTVRQRKALLAKILPATDDGTVRFSDHIDGKGPEIFAHACKLGTEGIISKRDAPYRSGRTSDWLKSKCLLEQEFVIAGFTDSTEGPGRFGSLILGVYDGGQLVYSGRSGTGYTQKLKRDLYKQLHALETNDMPFERRPADARRDTHWVQPKLVGQFRFASWTADNLVRQAAFLGLREDKPAKEVVREVATVKPKAERASRSTPSSKLQTPNSKPKPGAPSSPTASRSAKVGSTELPSTIRLTHPDKILDPESRLTKRQLAVYYLTVADRMLPHIVDRPLSLVRCPEGAGKPCFFQKHVNHMLPPGITGVDVPDKKTGKPEPYITITAANATPETLAGLAQMGVLEVHPWGSTNDDLEHPDRLIFDLDPDESLPWTTLCSAAAEIRKRLKRAGLESFLKTTGGKGLHVVAPITPPKKGNPPDWSTVKEAAHNLVLSMERSNPALYLTKMTKSARAGKIYLDYLRNERGATAVAPFSPRARLGCTVSLPLPWTALKLAQRPIFRVADLDTWRAQLAGRGGDPWKPMLSIRQNLDPAALVTS